MPNESTKILGVIELTSQRARLPNRRRTAEDGSHQFVAQ